MARSLTAVGSLLTIVPLVSVGCTPSYRFVGETTPLAPKSESCEVEFFFHDKPIRPFTVVGRLVQEKGVCNDFAAFKLAVARQVCAAGGDAVIAEVHFQCIGPVTVIVYGDGGT